MSAPEDQNAERLDQALAALPTHDLDAWRRERYRELGQSALVRGSRRTRLGELYDRFLEPAWVTGVSILYVHWAIGALQQLYS